MPRHYRSTIVVTELELDPTNDNNSLRPILPYHSYGTNYSENVDLNDLKNVGKEVMLKTDYRIVDFQGIPNEIEKAEKFAGNLGNDFDKLKVDPRYTEKYTVTKADKLATYDELGTKVEYDGVDKAEVTKFCMWEEPVKEIEEEEVIKETILTK